MGCLTGLKAAGVEPEQQAGLISQHSGGIFGTVKKKKGYGEVYRLFGILL